MKKTALISVSDKTNLIELAEGLRKHGYSIIATGGTAAYLKDHHFQVTEISQLTGFPEVMEGRVKTLNPVVFGGILYKRDNQEHQQQLVQIGAESIDVVCVNLYPFEAAARNPDSTVEKLIENIDIGGPSLIRAAAKNHKFVTVLTNPSQYEKFLSLIAGDSLTEESRRTFAVDAFLYTQQYDALISETLSKRFFDHSVFSLNYTSGTPLRYGENPHQSAGMYGDFYSCIRVHHGKELSYNNIMDTIAAVGITEEFERPVAAIIKHANPAGVAQADDLLTAYTKALSCDPVSAFGGIVSFNGIVDNKLAEKLNEIFLEVIIAEGYTDDALIILQKKKDRRVLSKISSFSASEIEFRSIPGGLIYQSADRGLKPEFKCVTEKTSTPDMMEEIEFSWKIVKHIRSNAILFTRDKMTLGIGGGQVSRIDAVRLAVMKAKDRGHDLNGSCVASDAFFPFADGLEECVAAGAGIIVQPGGSVRDEEVIAAANRLQVSMYFTGHRHFKH